MAIIEEITFPTAYPDVDEAVEVTVDLLGHLGAKCKGDMKKILTDHSARAAELGNGRLMPRLPAAVPFDRRLKLAKNLAVQAGYDEPYLWEPFWKNAVTATELNGSDAGLSVRLALFTDEVQEGRDPLLHFRGHSFDHKYQERGQCTQLELLAAKRAEFVSEHPGANLEAQDHLDFLTLYTMDLLRGATVARDKIVLSEGVMRVLNRRTVDGDSCVGRVCSGVGRARFDWSNGFAYDDSGLGLSVGFME